MEMKLQRYGNCNIMTLHLTFIEQTDGWMMANRVRLIKMKLRKYGNCNIMMLFLTFIAQIDEFMMTK